MHTEFSERQSTVLKDTLDLLSEVTLYLKRLPHVPTTLQLIRKIENHLGNPDTLSAGIAAKELERRKKTRTAGSYTESGLPVIEVEVRGDFVHLQLGNALIRYSENENMRDDLTRLAIQQLRSGIQLQLR